MSDTVLEQYLTVIESSSDLTIGHWFPEQHVSCLRLLATTVRALRIERAEERMAGHIHSKAADELAQTVYTLRCENSALQTRIAELEAILYPSVSDPAIDAFYLEADKG